MSKSEVVKRRGTNNTARYWLAPENLVRIQGLARDGLNQREIAESLDIHKDTFHRWAVKHPELRKVLDEGRDTIDRRVENALYQRALGYEVEETKTIIEILTNGKQRKTLEKVKRHIPPDTASMIFFLKNRKPKVWRDRHEIAVDVSLTEAASQIEDYMAKRLEGATVIEGEVVEKED